MVSLPIYTRMSDADVQRVVDAVRARWLADGVDDGQARVRPAVARSLALLLLSPLLLAIALWIKLDSPGPVFFRQERVGRHGVPFRIHKFRTMVADAPQRGPALTVGADARITRVGALAAPHASSTNCRS